MNNFSEKAAFLWSVADLLRDVFKRGKYQDVILPFTVLRRIDAVLEPTKTQVLATYAKHKGKLDNLDGVLCRASGYAFYNISQYTFARLLSEPANLAANLNNYINGFSPNMREVLEKFEFRNTITKLDEAGLLFLVVEKFNTIDLHPQRVSNQEMGYIFEELIRRFNEALNENPGEHFTPREVIRLMVDLMTAQDVEVLSSGRVTRTVYDPCCGTGGMLTVAEQRILEINPQADVFLYGQEVNPETFAVCKADLFMKSANGRDAENIHYGSTLSNDRLANERFNYLLSNPPYGKEWKSDQAAVELEAEKGSLGRFGAGLPRISDGQLLFLQHMLSRMHSPENGGGRVAIVMNGSPLFTGDAGSGESEIRRWILENDWLEAIVALPEQLFYNTGIATYIWILTNHKAEYRRGKVQLIDATSFWSPMRKSLGDKRREITEEHIRRIRDLFLRFEEGPHSKIFPSTAFGYRKITVERPLRLNYAATPERIARLAQQSAFAALATSKKKDPEEKKKEEQAGKARQQQIQVALATLPQKVFLDRSLFEVALAGLELNLSAPLRKAILAALSERDENANVVLDSDGNPEPDPELRDYENVPLGEDIDAFFDREVRPHVPDAWINRSVVDPKDRRVGKVGYEINFNRYFYTYQPPRPLEEIEAEIKALTVEIMKLLNEEMN